MKRSIPEVTVLGFLMFGAIAGGAAACSSSPGDVHATFVGVVAGSSDMGRMSGSLTVKVDGAIAMGKIAFAMPGGTAGTPSMSEMLQGSAHGGSYSMSSSDGWQMSGDVDGSRTKGTLSGPNNATAKYSAEDSTKGTVTLYCGTYSGSDSGIWNFAVGPSGDLSGAFSGFVSGDLTGSGNAQGVMISWSANDPLAGNLSGNAQGSISGNNSVTGSWQGSGNSGTFTSDQSCPGAPVIDTGEGGTPIATDDGGGTPPSTCSASGSICSSPSLCCSGQCYSQSGGASYCY